jgi:hypothetical protein
MSRMRQGRDGGVGGNALHYLRQRAATPSGRGGRQRWVRQPEQHHRAATPGSSCTSRRSRVNSASATSARRLMPGSRRLPPRSSRGGRCCRWVRPATAIRPTSASLPSPAIRTCYGTRRNPLGFSGNVRLTITATSLIIRVHSTEHSRTDRTTQYPRLLPRGRGRPGWAGSRSRRHGCLGGPRREAASASRPMDQGAEAVLGCDGSPAWRHRGHATPPTRWRPTS